jgi:hypothetical protein
MGRVRVVNVDADVECETHGFATADLSEQERAPSLKMKLNKGSRHHRSRGKHFRAASENAEDLHV